jgi:mannosyltransferase OCH1-like enzyme
MGIPKILHQTVRDKTDIHPAFRRNIADLQRLNRGWDYRLYDNADIHDFLGEVCGRETLRAWLRLNPVYGPARADFFRYAMLYHAGGVYLDIKSTCIRPLDEILEPTDAYLLSHWDTRHRHWGKFAELGTQEEYLQWYLIAEPGHPFLEAAIARVKANIAGYDQRRDGVGKMGVLRVTGPIAYTQAIGGIVHQHPHRLVDIESLGFKFSVVATPGNALAHEMLFKSHYRASKEPVVLPWDPEAVARGALCPCGSGIKHKRCHARL